VIDRYAANMDLRLALLGSAAALLMLSPAAAQTAKPAAPAAAPAKKPAAAKAPSAADATYDEGEAEVAELIVTASAKQPGSVIGDIPPELQFTPRDIQSLGVSNVTELIDALSTQLTSGQGAGRDSTGRPVILVNGVRVSSFNEIRDVPTEAILRADILPEEVALKYGYPSDTRVMNLVLRQRFRAIVGEGGYKTSTDFKGGAIGDVHTNIFHVRDGARLLIDGKASSQSRLLESDVELAQPRTDANFRSLIPEQTTSALNVVMTRPLKDGLAATLNGTIESSTSSTLLGVNTLNPGVSLRRDNEGVTGHLGGTLLGAIGTWRWTATANADRNDTDSKTERVLAGRAFLDTTNASSTSADGEFQLNGTAFRLPAGSVTTTLTGSAQTADFKTQSLRTNVAASGDLSRDTYTGKVNIDVPLLKRGRFGPEFLGDVSLNLNAAVEDVSDFGSLMTVGGGLNWSPISKLRLIASYTADEGAPTVQQVGNPVQVTPGVTAYDFSRGETSIISRVDGGNPTLKSDSREVVKLGMNLKPWDKLDLNFQANYVYTHIDDPISAFPTASSQIEAAFPDRFTRDASGSLLSIDARPVNFDERTTEQLRYGFTFRRPFGPQPPARPAGGFQRPAGAAGQGQRGQGQGAAGAAGGQRAQGAAGGQGGQRAPGAPGGQRAAGAAGAQNGQQQVAQADAGAAPAFGGAPPPGAGGGGFGGPPPGGGGGGGAGRGGFGGGPPGGFRGPGGAGGTMQISLFHTIKFQDEIRIRPGIPTLDLLDGGAIGNSGGTPRNQFDLQGNISRQGLGANVSARWTQGTKIIGAGTAGGTRDLYFSDLTTVSLRLFAELRQQPWFKDHPFFRGARAQIAIDNLFDQKQTVKDGLGAVPQTYQPDYLDPVGRTVRVSFRKLF
jgi:iron complex outermembrane receptor protein